MKRIIKESEFNNFVDIYGWKKDEADIARLTQTFEICISKLKSDDEYNEWANNGYNYYRDENDNIILFLHLYDTKEDCYTDIDLTNWRRIKNKNRYMFYMAF